MTLGIVCLCFAVVLGALGELGARNLANRRRKILASYPERIALIETKLERPTLSDAEREELEGRLHFLRDGRCIIHHYYPSNARLHGYGSGACLVLLGLACCGYGLSQPQKDQKKS